MPNLKLDVRNKCCPMPLIRLAKAVDEVAPGECIEIVGDDPIFELGVREFCMARGLTVEDKTVNGREVWLKLRIPVQSTGL
jgi:tRNA 2-thiouridine synthesizing protein A